MKHHKSYWLEKFSVQVTTLAAVCVVYFLLWRTFRQGDPQSPVAFVTRGDFVQGGWFAVMLWALAVACALTTLWARPEGAMAAMLLGAGGISLSSPSIRDLLWACGSDISSLYGKFILEVILLTTAAAVGCMFQAVIRRLAGRLAPGLLWKSPIPKPQPSPPTTPSPATQGRGGDSWPYCLLLALVISLPLLLVFMQSDDRNQILFALVFSFAISVLAAHQFFPTPHGIAALAAPALAAVLFYTLAAFTPIPASPQGWIRVPLYARALPIDWVVAGGGGAMLGCWISARLHELRFIEQSGVQGS